MADDGSATGTCGRLARGCAETFGTAVLDELGLGVFEPASRFVVANRGLSVVMTFGFNIGFGVRVDTVATDFGLGFMNRGCVG